MSAKTLSLLSTVAGLGVAIAIARPSPSGWMAFLALLGGTAIWLSLYRKPVIRNFNSPTPTVITSLGDATYQSAVQQIDSVKAELRDCPDDDSHPTRKHALATIDRILESLETRDIRNVSDTLRGVSRQIADSYDWSSPNSKAVCSVTNVVSDLMRKWQAGCDSIAK
ncbi:hypothetical protein N9L06_04415 [Mariniblastus sp.]|nr:hypothetical protein [Mariniblastus sp.]